MQEYVVGAADSVSTQHLRHLRHRLSEALRALLVVLVEDHQHERLETGSHPLRVDPGVYTGDHPVGAQARHSAQRGRRRQAHFASQLDVLDVSALLQHVDDGAIKGV